MPTPVRGRDTRSNTQSASLLSEIKVLIESSKNEVIDSLTSEITRLRDEIASLSQRVNNLEAENKVLKDSFEQMGDEMIEGMFKEYELRRKRETSVVVFGITEKTEGTLAEKKNHDFCKITDIFKELQVPETTIIHHHRLGRATDGKRPITLKLNSIDHRNKVLKAAFSLRNARNFSSVFIKPDLTPTQQDQRKRLLTELHNRRRNGEDVVIYRNKIVLKNSIKNFQ